VHGSEDKVQAPKTRRESISNRSLQTHRETLQLKKRTWLVGRKCTSTSSKKESWRDLKVIQEKTKKQDASSDSDTSERGIVHASVITALVNAKSWVSVVSSDYDDELLPNLASTSLARRKCLFFSSSGDTPSPRVGDLEGKLPQESLMALEPNDGVFFPS